MYRNLILCISFLFVSCSYLKADSIPVFRNIDSLHFVNEISNLEKLCGNNLYCYSNYKLQTLIALSYYPELKNCDILVEFSNISTTANCRPKLGSIFPPSFFLIITLFLFVILIVKSKRKSSPSFVWRTAILTSIFLSISIFCYATFTKLAGFKYKYVITININDNFEGILIKDIPFNAQIGLIGHEIAHIADYEHQSFWGLLGRAFDYIGDKSKQKFEKYIDSVTVEHGLGWQLYDWSDYAINKSKATEKYKNFKRKIYMQPDEIYEYMQKLKIYDNSLND